MSFLASMKIRSKLLLMITLPIIVALYFSIGEIVSKSKVLDELGKLQELSELAVKSTAFVHELQKERGASALYLGSGGKEFGAELQSQRSSTDQKADDFNNFLKDFDAGHFDAAFRGRLNSALSSHKNLDGKRSAITGMSIATSEAIGYYTSFNAELIEMVSYITNISTDAEISMAIAAYENFIENKERAGIERAVLSNTFAGNKFGKGMYQKFLSLVTEEDVFTNIFKAYGTDEQVRYYENAMQSNFVSEVNDMRKVAIDNSTTGNFGIDAKYWFKMITGKINILKDVEDRLSNDLKVLAAEKRSSARGALVFVVIFTIIALAVTALFTYLITRAITNSIKELYESMEELAGGQGDLTARLEVKGSDEIAETSQAFNKFIEGLHIIIKDVNTNAVQLSSASEQISSATEELASGADSQHKQASETASAMEEMAS
ncbi:MAG: methyl-accepting chemotaxis protein, partial [Deltaproteobacteria bacterium]|nr:methyl-accepting chemotaxis protein [Deltaproteobacteria bacterium]